MNNASEHVKDMGLNMSRSFEVLRPGGVMFIAHDNYYQPVGHHDHQYHFLNAEGTKVEPKAPPCWASSQKCDASAEFRANLLDHQPTVWSEKMNQLLNPHDCGSCPHYLRSQPWPHLRYQNQFNRLYPFETFRSLDQGYLNKITIRQLRQYALEAGFIIELEERYWLSNEIDEEISAEYARHDLLTFQYFLRLRKPSSSTDSIAPDSE